MCSQKANFHYYPILSIDNKVSYVLCHCLSSHIQLQAERLGRKYNLDHQKVWGGGGSFFFFLLFLPFFFFFFGSLLGKNFCLQFGQTTEWDDLLNAAHVQSTSLWDTTQLPGLLCNTQEKEELERTSPASLRRRRTGETEGEEAEKEYHRRSLDHQPTMRTHSTQGDRSIQQMWSEQESVMTAMCKQGSSSTNTKKAGHCNWRTDSTSHKRPLTWLFV